MRRGRCMRCPTRGIIERLGLGDQDGFLVTMEYWGMNRNIKWDETFSFDFIQ